MRTRGTSLRTMRLRGKNAVGNIFRKIDQALRRDNLMRGRGNENAAFQAAIELAEAGDIPAQKSAIRKTEPFSLEDKQGWDMVIETDRGTIPIQIKSSRKAMNIFVFEHPNISCVVISRDMNNNDIREILKKTILQQYESLLHVSVPEEA